MEANSHFESTAKPTIPNTSGLKQLPQSVEPVYISSSLVRFPQQAKGLNCDMPVNGRISPPMSTNANGTLDPSTTRHPVSNNYDYLWKFTKSPLLKDCHGLGQYQVNGSTSPVTNGPSCKASLQETWENCASSPAASLSFSGQGLYNFSEASVKLAAAANGTNLDYLESSRPVPLPAPSVQSFLTSSNERKQTETMGSNTREEAKTDSGLVEALKPCDVQADLRSHCNGANVALAPLCQATSSILPPPEVSNLDDPSQLPSHLEGPHLLNSDSLKPFGIDLAQDPGSCAFYDVEIQQQDKTQQAAQPSLDSSPCSNPSAFPVLTENRQKVSLFNAASPVVGESVRDSASGMAEDAEVNKDEEPHPSPVNTSQDQMVTEKICPEPIFAQEPEEDELEPGEIKGNASRRRMATAEEVRLPLLHGWKREVRIKKGSHRWQGETWYYAPCGKRMKQFPEVIKYLLKKPDPIVRREHFSFSPRMPVGDFYELRDTAEGPQWELLNSEEIPSRILAITGKRGRPRNMEKAKLKENKVKRGRGRPPKVKMIDLLSKPDAKLLRKLENQDILSDVEKVQLSKLRKKMRRKARNQEAKLEAAKNLKLKEKKDKEQKQKAKAITQEQEKNKVKRRPKEKANATVHKPDRKQLAQQRRLEERKRQQFMLEELKKPTEDMCLSDHQPLPDFPHVPGVVLPSSAFADCFTTVEFLQTYGKVLGLDGTKDIPSLFTLQEGLFNVGDSLGEVQDLLVKLLRAAMVDPGLPPYWQSLKILGEKVSEICLNRDNASEALRLFLEAYGGDGELCESLRTCPFQAHPPFTKAAVLAFLVNELNSSNLIINEIDKTLENMSHYRKNKWIIEGKLRRLKFALGKRTGTPETRVINVPEGCRRRSARITDENEEQEGDESALQQLGVIEEEEVASSLSVVELERQIEKLTKRQIFFRKKILSSSQRLRCASLGQDRYCRFYWLLPHLGGIFVEGSQGSAGHTPESEDTLLPLKTEEAEMMEANSFSSASRTRGRQRKPEAATEFPCKSCNCAQSQGSPSNDLVESRSLIAPVSGSQQDLNQSAFMSWLNQNQTLLSSTVLTPESSPPHTEATPTIPSGPNADDTGATEKQGQLVNIIPRTPCTDSSRERLSQPDSLVSALYPQGATPPMQVNGFPEEGQQPLAGTPLPPSSSSTPCLICGNLQKSDNPQSVNPAHVSEKEKRRGRPPSNFFKEIEQKYNSQLIERPIPADMKQKWWWIKDPAMMESMLKALHPRGIREKNLHKHLTKHLEHLKEFCSRPASGKTSHKNSIFSFNPTEGNPVSQETLDKWSVTDWTFQVDLSILQWVEDLEQRVLMSDLQQRGWTPPSLDSVRSDLKYFEHHLEATDDITVKVKKEEPLYREPCNPLDLAVLRLLDLEQNVERRYLKEPLWVLSEVQHEKAVLTDPENPLSTTEIEYSITPRLRLWRQTLERCRSAAQVSLCLQQLERSVAWERSVNKVICIVCRKGDNDEFLLLCDNCDRGCHTYCHRPRMMEIPEGDWFCPTCVSLQGEFIKSYGSSRRAKKPRLCFQEDDSPSKSSRRRDQATISQYSLGDAPLSKRRRIVTRSHGPDLTFCEIILMEMESHDDAWPFLEPVNPRIVPGYRKIIKNPMDFSTMRHKLLNGKYSSCEEFAEDAELVFSNCQLFNEDDSEVGKAGLAMRKFYESRWEEFSQERNQGAL
ncbi:bromodomain adjacent to zinc finger domain protein 2A [Spea bombifrons]|uniref:bromodomain adjacent to zinc finger domain protein 2A n=1 Tax=Spea bombifrons TaxID=233779 RepID=UPI0023490545|nr:bromodomain adjacent to zinc finger domain protein 2A [Spea bombifrons]